MIPNGPSINDPVQVWASAIGGVPAGAYTGNAHDELAITARGPTDAIHAGTTIHARGVPYRVGVAASSGRLDVDAPAGVATLTIEAGVTFRADRLHVGGREAGARTPARRRRRLPRQRAVPVIRAHDAARSPASVRACSRIGVLGDRGDAPSPTTAMDPI